VHQRWRRLLARDGDQPWSDEIQPLLLKRYSSLTADHLGEAHAYAYGGAVIQDLGYVDLVNCAQLQISRCW
jgi:hypothetical protein